MVSARSAGSSSRDIALGSTVEEGDSIGGGGSGGGGQSGASASGFRSGLMAEGDSSAFGPLVQIEENVGGSMDDMEVENNTNSGGGGGGGGAQQQQVRLTAWMVDVLVMFGRGGTDMRIML